MKATRERAAVVHSGRSYIDGINEPDRRRDVLTPGSRLPVENAPFSVGFGVSRSSLREGVRALALMGVLETKRGNGTYVTSLGASHTARPSGGADKSAASGEHHQNVMTGTPNARGGGRGSGRTTHQRRRTDQRRRRPDHDGVDDPRRNDLDMRGDGSGRQLPPGDRSSGSPPLSAMISGLASRTVRARLWRAMQKEGVERQTHAEHASILSALAARDPDAARLRMNVHLLNVEEYLTAHLKADSRWATG